MPTTFRTGNGRYLRAVDNGKVDATATSVGIWERWTPIALPDGWWAFRSYHNRCLRADINGLTVNQSAGADPNEWERFKPVKGETDGTWALQTWHGTYLSAIGGGGGELCCKPELHADECFVMDPPVQNTSASKRNGKVKLIGRSMADDGGAYLALGTSLFWAVRGGALDLARMKANVDWLAARGVDFFVAFMDTSDWADNCKTDPRLAWWKDGVEAMWQVASAAGMRVFPVLFGSGALSSSQQWAVVQDSMDACDKYADRVQGVEVSNEGFGFKDAGGMDRIRAYAAACRVGLFPVSLSSAAHIPDDWWVNSKADLGNEHFDRTDGENGWRYVRQPYNWWDRQGVPYAFMSREPKGILSSVSQDSDVTRQTMAAVETWLAGACAYVVHTGGGIYGVESMGATGLRPANVWEQPTLEPILKNIAAMRKILPGDLANWDRQNADVPGHSWPNHPFIVDPNLIGDNALNAKHGCTRAFAMTAGSRYVCAPISVMNGMPMTPRHPDTPYSVYAPDGTKLIEHGQGPLVVPDPAVVIISE